jgi:hypothetical protein
VRLLPRNGSVLLVVPVRLHDLSALHGGERLGDDLQSDHLAVP